jgi:hypothetical protein
MPPNTAYVTPGLQPGAWQHPTVAPPTQPGYQPAPGPYQQPQRVVVVVNAPNFGKKMYSYSSDGHNGIIMLDLPYLCNLNKYCLSFAGPNSIEMMCPHCQSQVRTSTDSEPGALAWILAGILCVVG